MNKINKQQIIRSSPKEDQEDLTDLCKRIHEPTISYEQLLEKLRIEGKI